MPVLYIGKKVGLMKKYKKLFVVVLSFMMVFTMIPASVGIAFAEDNIGEDSFVMGQEAS